jgi:hypothetical protein
MKKRINKRMEVVRPEGFGKDLSDVRVLLMMVNTHIIH